ncbi:MAG: hypothetical protein LWY06_07060 [Firmicutes bacterium]|nr:hypothetical protein [Bacillota bacterium]
MAENQVNKNLPSPVKLKLEIDRDAAGLQVISVVAGAVTSVLSQFVADKIEDKIKRIREKTNEEEPAGDSDPS